MARLRKRGLRAASILILTAVLVSAAFNDACIAQAEDPVVKMYAETYGSASAVIKVVSLEQCPRWTNEHPPAGTIEIVEPLGGRQLSGRMKVTWRPQSPGWCGSRDRQNQELWRHWRESDFNPAAVPIAGKQYIARFSLLDDGRYAPQILTVPYSQELHDAISGEVKQLRLARAAANRRWDKLDYSNLVNQATDVVVARYWRPDRPQLAFGQQIEVIKRLKDSAGPRGRAVARPLLSSEISFPTEGPFKQGMILFLRARSSTLGWTPPPGWPEMPDIDRKDREDYLRLAFNYKPAGTDWVVPYTAEREAMVAQAVAKQSKHQAPSEDLLYKYFRLRHEYWTIPGRRGAGQANLEFAQEMFDAASRVLTEEGDGHDLAVCAHEYESQLAINRKPQEAAALHSLMQERNRQGLSMQRQRAQVPTEPWYSLDY